MIAHRGASAYAPENTMEAFKLAKEHGLTAIELDTHETSDGVIVCIHDRTVTRTTNGIGRVSLMEWNKLARLDASYYLKFGNKYHGAKIPRIEEVLAWAKKNNMFVIWELKVGSPQKVVSKIKEFRMERQVWVYSLIWGYVDRIKRLAPEITTGLIGYLNWEACLHRRKRRNHNFVLWRHSAITSDKVITSKAEGFELGAYTVNSTSDMQRLINLDIDYIVGNYSDRMRKTADKNDIRLAKPKKAR